MKFSTIFVATAALVCASVSASQSDVGEVKGVPLVFEAPITARQATFIKGDAIIHSRSENLATSHIAVPDESNPYIKVKGTGVAATSVVGVALSVNNGSESSSSSSSSAWTAPLAVGGCAIAAVGIAGFVLMKKRKQIRAEEDLDAKTPANNSPLDEIVEYNTDMETPV